MNGNHLNWVEIKNFKSIKDLRLDCKRVNVFIGKPNVGKSNILEGLGLLSVNFDDKRFWQGSIRYKTLKDLFTDSINSTELKISSDLINVSLNLDTRFPTISKDVFSLSWDYRSLPKRFTTLGEEGDWLGSTSGLYNPDEKPDNFTLFRDGPVRKYDFIALSEFKSNFTSYLIPPYGWNLFSIIDKRDDLKDEFAALIRDQELELVLSRSEQTFVLQQKQGVYAYQYPYFSIADTFRRYMFYITAIESNSNSVIIFEEPEVHSFPPYIKAMTQRIVGSETNQFFISTHSPYLLHTLIDQLEENELAVYITYYKNHQTYLKVLTTDELQEARDLSIDLFYNLSRYEPNA